MQEYDLMTILPREEQERIAVQFERDYGELLMLKNEGKCKEEDFSIAVCKLSQEIFKAARPYYFEEDLMHYLVNLSGSIRNYLKISKISELTLPKLSNGLILEDIL